MKVVVAFLLDYPKWYDWQQISFHIQFSV